MLTWHDPAQEPEPFPPELEIATERTVPPPPGSAIENCTGGTALDTRTMPGRLFGNVCEPIPRGIDPPPPQEVSESDAHASAGANEKRRLAIRIRSMDP
jgi:hypothetical protein